MKRCAAASPSKLLICMRRAACLIVALAIFGFLPNFSAGAQAQLVQVRIINGTPVAADVPWMVSLSQAGSEPARGHSCGGTLVDTQFVVTAAHCVEDYVNAPDTLQVLLGRTRLTDLTGIIILADGVIIHPDYDPNTQQNDVALIRLSQAVPQYQPLVVISAEEQQGLTDGTLAQIFGWGATDPLFPVRPAVLQQASIPLVGDEQCQSRLGLDYDANSMMCAGVLASASGASDGIDTCNGDSGGPLVVETVAGPRLAGITSWGLACASDRYWGVYTRAAAFHDWIYSTRTVPPYLIAAPLVNGVPRVGERMHCEPGTFGGDALTETKFIWNDSDTGETLGTGRLYVMKPTDLGRSIQCNVTATNAGGSITATSNPTGPVFPKRPGTALATRSSAIKAGVYCLNGVCSIVLSFREPVRLVKGAVFRGQRCLLNSCTTVQGWKSAVRISNTSWRIPLKRSIGKFTGILIRATQLNSLQSSVYELDKLQARP